MGLAESCAMIGIPLGEHHDALCDATACAMILLKSNGIDCTVNTKPDHFDSKMFRGKEVKSETKKPLCDDEIKCTIRKPLVTCFGKNIFIGNKTIGGDDVGMAIIVNNHIHLGST